MSWVCPICSTSNEDTAENCFVCGGERVAASVPSKPSVETLPAGECRIFYSDWDAMKGSRESRKGKLAALVESLRVKIGKCKEKKKISSKSASKPVEKPLKKPELLKTSEFADPWPEHKIKLDIAAIKSKGYVRSERKNMNGVNGYLFFREDGSNQFIRAEIMVVQKMAHKS